MTELHVYDFDGTLFRSPEPPPGWDKGSWWSSEESLNRPCVPDKPGPEWWVESTVAQARKSIANPNVWAIVCTGRPLRKGGFAFRVPELVHQKGLRFDDIYLNTGGDTATFKKAVITKLVQQYPHIRTVHIWEDRAHHLESFIRHVEKLGLVGVPHLVREAAMPAFCTRETHPSLKTSSEEVTARWFLRQVKTADAQPIEKNLAPFQEMWTKLKSETLLLRARGYDGKEIGNYANIWLPWRYLHSYAPGLVKSILATKEIPSGKAKRMEMAARFFMSRTNLKRFPKNADFYNWFDKALVFVDLILEAATSWPEKTEGTDALFNLGPFRVHNTIGVSGRKLELIKTAVERATTAIRKLDVPGIQRVLYGDIHLVGQIQKAKTLAWYYPHDDSLYVRPFTSLNSDVVESLVHELGHRYLNKFADRSAKQAWARYHNNLELPKPKNVRYPEVGEKLDWIRGKPVVQRIEGVPGQNARYWVKNDRGYITEEQVARHEAQMSVYPTLYATTDWEEHFCEALAFKALGKLKPNQEQAFDRIWLQGR